MDTKLTGDIAELNVTVELLKLKLVVLKPYGDRLPYDIVVTDNKSTVFLKLQIKCAWYYVKGDVYFGNVNGTATNRKIYKKKYYDNIDYFVYYIPNTTDYYIIPLKATGKGMVRLYPHKAKPKRGLGYEIYRNAWNLIQDSLMDKTTDS